MNKSMLVGAVLGAVGVTAGGAVATYSVINSAPKYAEVLAVQLVGSVDEVNNHGSSVSQAWLSLP